MASGDARVPGGQGLLGGKLTDLKQRLLFVIGALVVFRIGTHIPVPGIDPVAPCRDVQADPGIDRRPV